MASSAICCGRMPSRCAISLAIICLIRIGSAGTSEQAALDAEASTAAAPTSTAAKWLILWSIQFLLLTDKIRP
ncbi:hypothetical protein D3C78_1800950 [compost metagenome]